MRTISLWRLSWMSSPIPDKRRAYQLGLRFGGRFGFCRQTA